MLQVYLVRHGETQWNAERRIQGQSDSPLTAKGEQQAMQVAIVCAGFTPSEADALRRSMATFKFTGGVTTPSLCGHVKPHMGWDLSVPVEEQRLAMGCCKDCVQQYRELVAKAKKEAFEAVGVTVGRTPSETAALMRGVLLGK